MEIKDKIKLNNKLNLSRKHIVLLIIIMIIILFAVAIGFLSMRTTYIDMTNRSGDLIIDDSGSYEITGISSDSVINVINGNPTITLNNLQIDVNNKDNVSAFKIGNSTSVKIILQGNNVLRSGAYCAGLQTQETSFLEISRESTGSLYAEGGIYGCGIGCGCSTISLNTYAPGIGTGQYFGIIALYGGWIEAVGGKYGHSIGGDHSENDKIIIDGAKLSESTLKNISTTIN